MKDKTPYAGRWVALIGEQVVGVGYTAEEAYQAAQHSRPRVRVKLHYVEAPGGQLLAFAPLMEQLRPILEEEWMPVYLVGGAVRDALLGRVSHDLDFVAPRGAVDLAFRVADAIGAPAYVLDEERDTGRVVLPEREKMIDFARFRGPNLEADLRDRDFTINALALPATAQTDESIIDPTGGKRDLKAGRIRLIHKNSLADDPVRTLRAVRLAACLDFDLTAETRTAVIAAVPGLVEVSAERKRDEIVKIIKTPQPDRAVAEMGTLGLLDATLPEIAALGSVSQSPPHREDVLAHTLSVLGWLVRLEGVLFCGTADEEQALKFARSVLEPTIKPLGKYLARPVDGGVDGRLILRLAALFHDVGKQDTGTIEEDGRIRFFGHDKAGAQLAGARLRTLCLSKDAVSQVKRIVAGHMRPLSLVQAQGAEPSRRAVFRYYRAAGHNGLDIGLLALADHLATYDGLGEKGTWEALVGLVRRLFLYFFERYDEAVEPVPLVNGRDLIDLVAVEQGPEIGRILRLIKEGQAAGEIRTREEALRFAQEQMI
jgi:putative nucleotidyltransferase with HDIG domain